MGTTENKQEILDKRYMRMATIWSENSYCARRKVGFFFSSQFTKNHCF